MMIDPNTGQRRVPDQSVMGILFGHWDYKTGREPAGMGFELEHMTEVVVHLPVKTEERQVTCRSNLRSTKVVFED